MENFKGMNADAIREEIAYWVEFLIFHGGEDPYDPEDAGIRSHIAAGRGALAALHARKPF